MNFIEALKVAETVMAKYLNDYPKWWKRMDGTPILNDLPVRMAEAFAENDTAEVSDKSVVKCECCTLGPDYCVMHAS